jgi:hypothetical protein
MDAFDSVDFRRTAPGDSRLPTEGRQEIRYASEAPIEASRFGFQSSPGFVEFVVVSSRKWSGWAEWVAARAFGAKAAAEHLGKIGVNLGSASESRVLLADESQIRVELAAIPIPEALLPLESLSSGVSLVSADAPAYLGWADPPALLLIAAERLLCSPGRVRILAARASVHPLRGQ